MNYFFKENKTRKLTLFGYVIFNYETTSYDIEAFREFQKMIDMANEALAKEFGKPQIVVARDLQESLTKDTENF